MSSGHRIVTVSLSVSEFQWLKEFVAVLEGAGIRRARSAVVSVALAELRKKIGKVPPHEMVKRWLLRDTKRLIEQINSTTPSRRK